MIFFEEKRKEEESAQVTSKSKTTVEQKVLKRIEVFSFLFRC